LHGLILADAYGVPNVWAKFSDRLVGGDWKFRDYYSVTDAINPAPTVILSGVDLVRAINSVPNTSQIAKYQGSLELLLDAFPLERPHRSGPPFGI
jgi:pyruvyltransferase